MRGSCSRARSRKPTVAVPTAQQPRRDLLALATTAATAEVNGGDVAYLKDLARRMDAFLKA
jgi:hypothetical protein